MAAHVRLDITPSEFDLIRAALDAYDIETFNIFASGSTASPREKQDARERKIKINDLIAKLR